jgi:dipeptidyl aminopeptidase/acylaminoacyl peptidase
MTVCKRSQRLWLAVVPMLLAAALPAPARAELAGLPPLIDRELIFGDPEISRAQLSPDGQYLAFVKPLDGTRNIWVKRTDEPFEAARPVTADTKRPVPYYFWRRDGKDILFVQDQGGDENYNVYAVDPAAEPEAGQKVPAARNLTDVTGARALLYHVPKSAPDTLYVGLNDRDAAWHDLYEVTISTGQRTALRQNTERITSWIFDRQDRLRLATRSAENGDTEVLRVDETGFVKVYSCSVFESCYPMRFHKDGKRVYMVTNKGADVDLVRLMLFDPVSGQEELIEADPLGRVDLAAPLFSEATDELIATVYQDEKTRIHWLDKTFEADHELVKDRLKGLDLRFVSSTDDERLWLVSSYSDTEPGDVHLFDRQTKTLTPQYRLYEKLPREPLARLSPIRYPSSDGLEIPAYLALPEGVPAKGLPLVVLPHGGPWARDGWGYNPYAQFLANRGYAVLLPNFRGSTGYGKRFLDAGNKEWGQKMQDDLTWGVKHLVAEGIADPARIGIMGASYGGYAALAGLAFTPDVYAAGVSIVGPSNLITLLESIPPYWEAGRKLFHERMGDPGTPEGKAQLVRQSPLSAADQIRKPLLVIQGANDPRVKKAESDQIVVALRERQFPVEYLVAPDEGHGFSRPVNNMAMLAAVEKFLASHLGGRYQEGGTPEVEKRLGEITVDVSSVELPKQVDAAELDLPKAVAALQPGTASYQATIELAGQSIPMTMTRQIEEQEGVWVVTEKSQMPMGEISDRTTLDKKTLALVQRSVQQGPVAIELRVDGGKASGTMSMNGQDRPFEAELGGDLFADGAGADAVLALLPLESGSKALFRTFDLQTQKLKLMQLEVADTEQVTVPAGTFEVVKLEVGSAEGEPGGRSVWVDPATRRVVKMRAVLPQMNGAIVTVELAAP